MRLPRYFLVIVAALALSACGESTLDMDNVEKEIAPQVEERTGTRDVAVSCPDDVEAEEGDEFDCVATAEGGVKATVTVTQEDDDGSVHLGKVQP